MDPKPEDILTVDLSVDIDPTILLGLEFEKMKFVSQLDVESVLSEGDNNFTETSSTSKEFENKDSPNSDTNSESDVEEPTLASLERNKDINGNEETLSDYNLNQLFYELDLSDSDNEGKDEGPSSKLIERGGPDRNYLNKKQNRTNYVNRRFLSGSSFVQSSNVSQYFSLENNHSSACYSNEAVYNRSSSEPVSTSYPQFYEDSRANSIGSPESGYESSITGSPPPILSSTFINQKLEYISHLDDDQFVDYVIQDCALTDHVVPKQIIDRDCKEKRINELVEYLKDIPSELVEVSKTVASCNKNKDIIPVAKNFEIVLPPILKTAELPKLKYKLKDEAKKELRRFLSQEKFYVAEKNIFKRLIEDKKKKKPIRVIYVIDEIEIRTNLHYAVLKQNLEEIYCLVEIQKIYDLAFSDLNIRDKYMKTALDYAIQQDMHLAVIEYLKENTAHQNVIV